MQKLKIDASVLVVTNYRWNFTPAVESLNIVGFNIKVSRAQNIYPFVILLIFSPVDSAREYLQSLVFSRMALISGCLRYLFFQSCPLRSELTNIDIVEHVCSD